MNLFYRLSACVFMLYCTLLTASRAHAQTWTPVGTPGFSAGAALWESIVIDRGGTPYVAYIDEANGNRATVKKFNGSSWIDVGAAGFTAGEASYISIVLDTNDVPYIVYTDMLLSNKITVMKYSGGSWSIVGTAGFSITHIQFPVIAIDKNNTPYVAYEDFSHPVSLGAKITVMKFNGSSWVTVGTTGFSSGIAAFISMAFDTTGAPYVAFEDGDNMDKVSVMKYNGSGWSFVGGAGFSPGGDAESTCIVFDGAGVPYVAYQDMSSGPSVMRFNGTTWETIGGASMPHGIVLYRSLAIDSANVPFLAYCSTLSGVSVSKFDGSNWIAVGDTGFSDGFGAYTSIAIAPDGIPYVAYYEIEHTNKATVMRLDTSTTSIKKLKADAIVNIYPNPASSNINISSTGPITSIIINNLWGQVQYSEQCNTKNVRVNIDKLTRGTYFIRVNEAVQRTIVKN